MKKHLTITLFTGFVLLLFAAGCGSGDNGVEAPGNSAPNYPSNPTPAEGATNQSIYVNLSWSCSDPDDDPLTYDVYFGTSGNPPQMSTGQSETTYAPDTLNYEQTYYWQIVAHDDHENTTSGAVWSFATMVMEVPDPDSLASEGWVLFQTADYAGALERFMQAISIDENHLEACTGAGWCEIRLGQVDEAIAHFDHALTVSSTYGDALVGAVVASVLHNDFADAATHASGFLTAYGDSYVFSHDETVSSRDVRILYALASYHIGDYAMAEAQVEHLDPAIDLDPSAPSYRAELLAAIESLMG